MDDNQALVLSNTPEITITIPASPYDGSLAQISREADQLSQNDVFADYHRTLAPNTLTAQQEALHLLARFLESAGSLRLASDLYTDPWAWCGISHGLLKRFRTWMLEQGYALGTINQRLAIVRQYCQLAGVAGVLTEESVELILTVKGYSGKVGRNVDLTRASQGNPTRQSTKKAQPTRVRTSQAHRLKRTTTTPERKRRQHQDILLTERDALLMGLLIEHALRVSEVVGLDIEHFDLERSTVTVYSSKNDETHTQRLMTHTRQAAVSYLAVVERSSGPLFLGYKGRRITRYGLYDRVQVLGQQVGIERLSPHDLRHFWTIDALAQGTSVDRVQAGGNWKSPLMVLRYAKRTGIANEGVKISEETWEEQD